MTETEEHIEPLTWWDGMMVAVAAALMAAGIAYVTCRFLADMRNSDAIRIASVAYLLALFIALGCVLLDIHTDTQARIRRMERMAEDLHGR